MAAPPSPHDSSAAPAASCRTQHRACESGEHLGDGKRTKVRDAPRLRGWWLVVSGATRAVSTPPLDIGCMHSGICDPCQPHNWTNSVAKLPFQRGLLTFLLMRQLLRSALTISTKTHLLGTLPAFRMQQQKRAKYFSLMLLSLDSPWIADTKSGSLMSVRYSTAKSTH